MKVLFIDTVHPLLINSLRENGHECIEGYNLSREEINNNISSFDGIVIRSRLIIDKELIDNAAGLKFIARAGAGMENIDVAYAGSKNIFCLNSPEANRDAVGEHAVGMLLSLMNNLNRADRQVRNKQWIREGNRGHELKGRTVGIIGCGNMGSAFAEKLRGFGCTILAYDKYRSGFGNEFIQESTLEDLQQYSDIVSLHVPLTKETDNFVNDYFISAFNKNIYVVNTARGKCVNTRDLVKNIKSGKITGACLDVIEYEDTSFESLGNNDMFEKEEMKFLIDSDRVILSPHIAGWTFESNEKIAEILFQKIIELKIN
jgi:D-3-phosphoglycerate dehydrogenase